MDAMQRFRTTAPFGTPFAAAAAFESARSYRSGDHKGLFGNTAPAPSSRGRRSTRRWRLAALVWVDWFNMRRLLGPIGDIMIGPGKLRIAMSKSACERGRER